MPSTANSQASFSGKGSSGKVFILSIHVSYVISGKLLTFSGPLLLQLYNKHDNTYFVELL